MNEFKRKIRDDIVNPADRVRRGNTLIGRVTKSDERNNTCSVNYMDMDGYKSNKDNVPVRVHSPTFMDWFPAEGEYVYLDDTDAQLVIVSAYDGGYGPQIRSKGELKKDIFHSSFGGTMAGSIF